MRTALAPRVHLFVCANRREGSPLGPGCGDHGDALYQALKREVAARGLVSDVWVTRTHCLGICPKRGATIAMYPSSPEPIRADVVAEDAAAVVDEAVAGAPAAPAPAREAEPWAAIERELATLDELQTAKVLDLARRLKPGLTLEDIQNPHDFPELDDPDWHYADGVLAGVQSVASALRALKNRT
jgi:(2Fe-2S) ferredoxin